MFKRTRKQTGQFIETHSAFLRRYYATTPTGDRKKITVKLADKSTTIQTRADVEHLAYVMGFAEGNVARFASI